MLNSKAYRIIQALSPKELKQFGQFVRSPFFNTNERLIELYDLVLKAHSKSKDKDLSKEQLFKKLYPKRTFDDTLIRKEISSLFKLLKQFLAQLEFDHHTSTPQLYLLRGLQSHEIDHLFQLEYSRSTKSQSSSTTQSPETFLFQYHIAAEGDLYFERQQKRGYDEALQLKTNNLDLFYLAAKLKESCEMINRQNIIQSDYQVTFLQELLDQLHSVEHPFLQEPYIQSYLAIYDSLLNRDDDSYYYNLLAVLDQYSADFPLDESVGMYSYAMNYCVRKINQGAANFLAELFKLYKILLDKNLMFEKGYLSLLDYKNIVTVGNRLGEFDWVYEFLHDFKNKLKPKERENAFNYNLAAYYYAVKQYDNAIQLLSTVEFSDIYFEISGKYILLKTYYDTNEFEPLEYLIKSFKIFIQRNKTIAGDYKKGIDNFLTMLKQIVRLKHDKAVLRNTEFKEKFLKAEEKLANTSPIFNSKWLKDKLAEFNT